MKRKTIKPIIISALMAVSFGATAVGTTFALFTDRADTKIELTAGKVEIEAGITEGKFYSLDEQNGVDLDVNGAAYEHPSTATKVTVKDNEVTLQNIVPGDKIVLKAAFENKSNVNIKYRMRLTKSGNLLPALTVATNGITTRWTELKVDELVQTESGTVTIELPNTNNEITAREQGVDNQYQGKTATFKFDYEAVQGNARVVDDVDTEVPTKIEVVSTAAVNEPFFLEAGNGLVLTSGVSDEEATKLTVEEKDTGAIVVSTGSDVKKYDITVENYKDAVEVSLFLGKDLTYVHLEHNHLGTVTTLVHYELNGLNNFGVYNPASGYVTFKVTNFSEFNVETKDYKIVTTATEFKNIMDEGKYNIMFAADMELTAATGPLVLTRDVKIYGQDKEQGKVTVSTNNGNTRVFNAESVDNISVSFENLKIAAPASQRAISFYNTHNLTVDINKCEISADFYALNFASQTTIDVNINNSKVSGWAALNIWSKGISVNAKNSVFEGINDKGYSSSNTFSTICLESDTTGMTPLHSEDMRLVFDQCELSAKSTTGNKQAVIGFNNGGSASQGATNNIVEIKDSTIIMDNEELNPLYYDHGANNKLLLTNTMLGKEKVNFEHIGYRSGLMPSDLEEDSEIAKAYVSLEEKGYSVTIYQDKDTGMLYLQASKDTKTVL